MKVGDLVRYARGRAVMVDRVDKGFSVGIVVCVRRNNVVTVLWNNGIECNHSSGWVVRIKEQA